MAIVNGTKMKLRLDTCATVNVLDEDGYRSLVPRPALSTRMRPTYAYNASRPLETLGKFFAEISCKGKSMHAEFIVMKGK